MMYVTLETTRQGYAPDQCGRTLTVRELIDCLSGFDEDARVYFSNDNGYTYGSISYDSLDEKCADDEEC